MFIPQATSGIFGSLEIAKSNMQNGSAALLNILKTGEKRLRKEDVMRAKRIIKEMKPSIKAAEVALKEFEQIAV